MTRRSRVLIAALIAALATGAGVWCYRNFEWVEVTVESGFRGEARRNHLLAAERFLTRLGLAARSRPGLETLPETDLTVLWDARRSNMPVQRAREIVGWVERGGHLVVTPAQSGADGEDPILAAAGVGSTFRRDKKSAAARSGGHLVESGNGLKVSFDPRRTLKTANPAAEILARSEYGIHALARKLGRGRVTVLSDSRFMANRQIGEHDHAAFLWYIVQPRGDSAVLLVYARHWRSLPRLLADHGWTVLVSGGCLLGIWLWSASRRFGPIAPDPPVERRRQMEHIEAGGHFLWRTGHGEALRRAVRESLLRSLEFRHPGWAASPQLHERLAQVSGLSAERVRQALESEAAPKPLAFIETIQTCEIIRRSL